MPHAIPESMRVSSISTPTAPMPNTAIPIPALPTPGMWIQRPVGMRCSVVGSTLTLTVAVTRAATIAVTIAFVFSCGCAQRVEQRMPSRLPRAERISDPSVSPHNAGLLASIAAPDEAQELGSTRAERDRGSAGSGEPSEHSAVDTDTAVAGSQPPALQPLPDPLPRPELEGTADGFEFLRNKFELAQRQFDQAQYYSAYRLADAILVLQPEIPFRREAMELRRRAQAYHLGSKVVVVDFVPDPKLAAEFPITLLRGSLHIENVGEETVTIGRVGQPGILGQGVFTVTDLFADGGESAATGSRTLRYDKGTVLETGESVDLPVELEVPRALGAAVAQVVELQGNLRSTLIRRDGEKIVRQIPWRTYRGVLHDGELEGIDNAPFEHLQLALITADAPRFVTALRLWRIYLDSDRYLTAPRRDHTIEFLLSDLKKRDDNPIESLVILALEQLAGENRRRTRESWLIFAAERDRDRAR